MLIPLIHRNRHETVDQVASAHLKQGGPSLATAFFKIGDVKRVLRISPMGDQAILCALLDISILKHPEKPVNRLSCQVVSAVHWLKSDRRHSVLAGDVAFVDACVCSVVERLQNPRTFSSFDARALTEVKSRIRSEQLTPTDTVAVAEFHYIDYICGRSTICESCDPDVIWCAFRALASGGYRDHWSFVVTLRNR